MTSVERTSEASIAEGLRAVADDMESLEAGLLLCDAAGDDLGPALARAVVASWLVDEAKHRLVDALRETGESWADLGDRLGISRQAAHKRFGSPLPFSVDSE